MSYGYGSPPPSGGIGTVATYASLPTTVAVGSVYFTQDDSMYWIYQEGTWRPIRSRIFGFLRASKDTSNFNKLTGSIIKNTKDEGFFSGLSGSMIASELDP